MGNPMEMSMYLREVYEKIFNNKNNYKIGNIEKFLQERLVLTDLPKFSKTVADFMDEQILGEEVDCAVEKLKGGTAPGNDLATPELIIFIHGIVPSLIKDFVIEFLKGNKEDRLNLLVKKIIFIKKVNKKKDFKQLRPIALATCLLKIVSHTLLQRLEKAIIKNKILPPNFVAYRKARGAGEMGLYIRRILNSAYYKGKKVVGVQIDYSGAFENCSRDYLFVLLLPFYLCNK